MLFVCHLKILHKHCFQFLLGVKMALRETVNNASAKFCVDKQRALWYVMVFLEWSIREPDLEEREPHMLWKKLLHASQLKTLVALLF